ncbi:MAG TPA: DUF1697 domain-containing protein [Candidatus Dormibacteraeota bacterium]
MRQVPTHIALLRGINVGGNNRIAMSDLRAIVASLGHADVATYIQSGNVVFTAGDGNADTSTLAADLERSIADRLGLRPRAVVYSRDELAGVVRDNPFPEEANPKQVHAVFTSAVPGPEMVESVADAERQAAAKGGRDRARFIGRTLYLHTPDGFGRSELALLLGRARGPMASGSSGTARNWATVRKLLEMCAG